jgi:D-alanyl-D-alanine carboxypeptidase
VSTTRRHRRAAIVTLLAGAALLALALAGCGSDAGATPAPSASPLAPTPTATATPVRTPTPAPTPNPDAWLLPLVSKEDTLPADFVPQDLVTLPARWVAPGYGEQQLVRPAADALETLLDAAHAAGLDIRVRSSYRSYATQQATFAYWVQQHGLAEAERESARAGHSEHQLGTTVDLSSASVAWDLDASFGQAPEGLWVAAHAWEFGFALSYPEGKEAITGYEYEPWHIRFIGRTQAAGWHASGLTLIEYLRRVHATMPASPTASPTAGPTASATPGLH